MKPENPGSTTSLASGSAIHEAPIVSIEEARKKRQRRQEEEKGSAEEQAQKAWQKEHEVHRTILEVVIRERRMLHSDFTDLVKLGLVTDVTDYLPCTHNGRRTHYYDWVEAYYGGGPTDPDEDLFAELEQQLREQQVAPNRIQDLLQNRRAQIPTPGKVVCPLLCYDEKESPPCTYALRNRYTTEFDEAGNLQRNPIVPDEDDVVLTSNFHPCVFLGRELHRVVMSGVWAKEPTSSPDPSEDQDLTDDLTPERPEGSKDPEMP